jgi:hypothetical protein
MAKVEHKSVKATKEPQSRCAKRACSGVRSFALRRSRLYFSADSGEIDIKDDESAGIVVGAFSV